MNNQTSGEQELIANIARVLGLSKHSAAMKTVRKLIQEHLEGEQK